MGAPALRKSWAALGDGETSIGNFPCESHSICRRLSLRIVGFWRAIARQKSHPFIFPIMAKLLCPFPVVVGSLINNLSFHLGCKRSSHTFISLGPTSLVFRAKGVSK